MNQGMSLFEKRKKNNGGFSLIEILLAIAILAIVIGPIFGSFITSAKVNMNARKTMAATNVAQTIMEGFADKRYSDISGIIGNMGGVDLIGTSALSSVDNNYYNMQDNCAQLDASGSVPLANLSAASANEIKIDSQTYKSTDLISGNATMGLDTVSINSMVAATAKTNLMTMTNDKMLLHWSEGSLLSSLVYTNVELEGYHFDVIVTFLPMAKSDGDMYYSYCVTVSVYDADSRKDEDGDGEIDRLQSEVLLNTMLGGIAK